jgi:hypothetical protein
MDSRVYTHQQSATWRPSYPQYAIHPEPSPAIIAKVIHQTYFCAIHRPQWIVHDPLPVSMRPPSRKRVNCCCMRLRFYIQIHIGNDLVDVRFESESRDGWDGRDIVVICRWGGDLRFSMSRSLPKSFMTAWDGLIPERFLLALRDYGIVMKL